MCNICVTSGDIKFSKNNPKANPKAQPGLAQGLKDDAHGSVLLEFEPATFWLL